MYNGGIPFGAAINTGVPATVLAVSDTGHALMSFGITLVAVAAVNALLLYRAGRQLSRSYVTPA